MSNKKQKAKKLKKQTLAKQNKRTKWAPAWVVLKKFGMGKRVHPSVITRTRRNWRRTKLRTRPYKRKKAHLG